MRLLASFLVLLIVSGCGGMASPVSNAAARQTVEAPTVQALVEDLITSTPLPTHTPIVSTPTSFPVGGGTAVEVTPTPSVIFMEHVVVYGDTLGKIARLYGIPVKTIKFDNGIQNENLIYVGQILVIRMGVYNEPIPPGISG